MDREPRWTSSPVSLHAVQCARCLKWRVIPTKGYYEAIRERILERPWVCENAVTWRPESHCDLPADIQQDQTMLWAIDKPNLPPAPPGWERQITVRSDGSSRFADVYYTAPVGKRLRSKNEIRDYLLKNPDPETSLDQFSFAIPRPLPGICPQLTSSGQKTSSANLPVTTEQLQLALQASSAPPAGCLALPPPADVLTTQPAPLVLVVGASVEPHEVNPAPIPRTEDMQILDDHHLAPDLAAPNAKRTKQQVKRARLGSEVPPVPVPDLQPPVTPEVPAVPVPDLQPQVTPASDRTSEST